MDGRSHQSNGDLVRYLDRSVRQRQPGASTKGNKAFASFAAIMTAPGSDSNEYEEANATIGGG